jgi:cytochrome P450
VSDDAIDFEELDYFVDESLLADPYPYFEHLRAQCPVQREPHHGVVAITGLDEAAEVLRDSADFSACNSVSGPFSSFPGPDENVDDVGALIEQYRDQIPMGRDFPTQDPPRHTDLRALLMRLLTPKRLKENEEFMWRLADRQLDELLARGDKCEFISAFADPYTLLIIADLLGVPEAEHPALLEMRMGSAGKLGGGMKKDPQGYLKEAFATYIEDRRANPRDDVLTKLATATFPDGSTPAPSEVAGVAAFLFVAGQETTVRLLAAALQLLGERPDLQQLLRDERERIPNFIEETLRIESPVKSHFRMARVDTTVAEVDVPAGTTVMLLDGAANRDPRHFERPDEFDVDRPNARHHIAFGLGIHTCPGAPLARAEARVALERILDRMTDIRISEAEHGPEGARRYQYLPTYLFRGLANLHIEFTPAASRDR